MSGSSNRPGQQSITFTDNISFDGTARDGALSADGELWIGATDSNRADDGGHVRKGTLTAGAGVTITNGAGSITIGLEATPENFAELKWKASDFDAVETNFAPIDTDAGANAIETIRSFDDSTEEYVNFSFIAPTTMTTGTVTFRAYGYAATAAADRFVQFRLGHTALAASDSWDQTYTNVDSGDAAVDATQDDITVIEWTETIANLGWTAEDLVIARLSRIAPSGTNLTGDFQLISFAVEVPITAVAGGGGGGGGVQSVNGTANRITSSGGTNPVINIDTGYVGQASITTLGTVTTGTWNADVVSESYGGTNQTTYSTGDIIYASAPNTLSKRAIGTAGQVLTVSGGAPNWGDNPLVVVDSQSAPGGAGVASIVMTTTEADPHVLVIQDVQPVTNGASLTIDVSNDGGSTWEPTGYTTSVRYWTYNSTTQTNDSSTLYFNISGPIDNTRNGSFVLNFGNFNIGSRLNIAGTGTWFDSTLNATATGIQGGEGPVTGCDAIRIKFITGNIANGRFVLYRYTTGA